MDWPTVGCSLELSWCRNSKRWSRGRDDDLRSSGGPGAGKTTLLKELLGAVSPLERIVTVEKGLLELRLEDDPRHPDTPALYTRSSQH